VLTLEARNVSKAYGDKWALKGFSGSFSRGVYGILGPNGSGKTTLMRILATVLYPSEGRVLMNGRDIWQMGERYRSMLGYLPQELGVYKNFTARKFLHYIAVLKQLDRRTARRQVEELLEKVGLKEAAGDKVGTFSGGMKRRLGIAQTLLNNPQLIIVDEPTAGLDPGERARFRNMLVELSGNRTVVISTHIVSDLEFATDDIFLLKEGRLLGQKKTTDLLKEMQGKVWESSVGPDLLEKMKTAFPVSSLRRQNGEICVRFLANSNPPFPSRPVNPNLEDAYLHYFGERGDRNEGVGQD